MENIYEEILLNSICDIKGIDSSKYKLYVNLLDVCGCNLRQALGYFLYTLQAIEFIRLEQASIEDYVNRKITIKQPLENHLLYFKNYVYEKTTTEFGGII